MYVYAGRAIANKVDMYWCDIKFLLYGLDVFFMDDVVAHGEGYLLIGEICS